MWLMLLPLHKGNLVVAHAIVDDDEFDRLSEFRWRINNYGYGVRDTSRKLGKKKTILLHRFVMNYDGPLLIDHKDRNRLNNVKSNLRVATYSENNLNRTIPRGSVLFDKARGKWRARCQYAGSSKYLGRFDTETEAQLVVDEYLSSL